MTPPQQNREHEAPWLQYAGENSVNAKVFEYTVHILAYNSIIKADTGAGSGACGAVNCYTRGHHFKDA